MLKDVSLTEQTYYSISVKYWALKNSKVNWIRKNSNVDELIEWAEVYGNLYGVPKYQITSSLKDGKDVIVKTDVQGAATIKRLVQEAVLVFLSVENPSDLETRLATRMTETNNSLNLRVRTAKSEIEEAASFDHILINKENRLDETVTNFEAIIEVERSRSSN